MKRGGPNSVRCLLLLPYLAGALMLVAVPVIATGVVGFCRYDGLAPPQWAGVTNFMAAFQDVRFGAAAYNSAFFILAAIPLRLLGAVLLAVLFNRPRPGIRFLRSAVLVPTVVPDAAYAMVWLWIFNPLYGPLNQTLAVLGLPTPGWLADPVTARLVFVAMSFFQIGEGFLIVLAGLKQIPGEYFDAARVDGGTPWQTFSAISAPLLLPWMALLSIRDIVQSLQFTFTHALLMTGGDPYYSTLFVPLLAYEEAFDHLRFGVGAAVTSVTTLLGGLLIAAWLRGGLYRRLSGGP